MFEFRAGTAVVVQMDELHRTARSVCARTSNVSRSALIGGDF